MSTYRNYYLVYLIDVGRVSLVEQICLIPDEYKKIPMQVFAIELKNILCEAKNFVDCLSNGQNYIIKAQPTLLKISTDRMPCSIVSKDEKKIAEVETFQYLGRCEKVDLSDWVEPLVSGSVVYVTRAINHSEVYISLICTKMYPKIFSDAAEDCEQLKSAKKGDLILAKDGNEYFRAKLIDASNETANVLNVDTGRELSVSIKTWRKPNLFVVSCPYQSRRVKLLYLANVSTPYTDNKALATLEQCQATGAEFILKFDSTPEIGVELILQTSDHQSLNKQLLPMLFEKRPTCAADFVKREIPVGAALAVSEKIIPNKQPPPQTTSKVDVKQKKKYTLQDLEVIPITCGDNIPLMITDSSTISKGYVSACDIINKAFLKKLESEYLPLVAKHCASTSSTITEYCPTVDEICLAVFNADNEWYRALCINEMKNDKFYVYVFGLWKHVLRT